MKKSFFIISLMTAIGLMTVLSQSYTNSTKNQVSVTTKDSISEIKTPTLSLTQQLYQDIGLEGKLKFKAFELAMTGYQNLSFTNKNIISVIDFTLPSTEKRMWILDLKNKKVLFNTIVSHGRNSGEKYANSFSNRHGSFQSSLGFYTTQNTYQGGNGYSLVLDGLERGINDQAKPRAVVIHGADYCSEDVIRNTGRLGRSYGCPALPRELNAAIINTIKNGTMLFIYAENEQYLASSKLLKSSKTMLAQHDNVEDNTRVN